MGFDSDLQPLGPDLVYTVLSSSEGFRAGAAACDEDAGFGYFIPYRTTGPSQVR